MDTCFWERLHFSIMKMKDVLSKTNFKINNTNSKKDALFNLEYIAYIRIIGTCVSPYNIIWLRCGKTSQENLQFTQRCMSLPAKLRPQRSCGMSVAVCRRSCITSWTHTVSYSPWRLCFPLASSLHSAFFPDAGPPLWGPFTMTGSRFMDIFFQRQPETAELAQCTSPGHDSLALNLSP